MCPDKKIKEKRGACAWKVRATGQLLIFICLIPARHIVSRTCGFWHASFLTTHWTGWITKGHDGGVLAPT